MEKPADTRLTPEVAREICQRQGAKALLSGSLSHLGTRYVLTLTAQNAANAEQLAYAQTRANSKEAVLEALDKASLQLRGKLGESLASLQKYDKPLEQATTSSLPALKALTLGNVQLRNGDSLEAIPFFKRAIELDPDFAAAYSSLAGTYFNMGQPELALQYSGKPSNASTAPPKRSVSISRRPTTSIAIRLKRPFAPTKSSPRRIRGCPTPLAISPRSI